MKRSLTCGLLMMGLVTCGSLYGQSVPSSTDVPASVQEAHAAYLSGDFDLMNHKIVQVLTEAGDDQEIVSNMKQLLLKAFETNDGWLPELAPLPPGISRMKLIQNRAQENLKIKFSVELKGLKANDIVIHEARLFRYPNELIAAKGDPRFQWTEKPDGKFSLKAKDIDSLPEGLYRVEMSLKDGTPFSVTLPVFDWTADRTPDVTVPLPHSNVTTPNPVITWNPFSFPIPHTAEVSYSAEVIKSEAPHYEWDLQWALYDRKPGQATSYTVGKEPAGHGVAALGKGRHVLRVVYKADRNFGKFGVTKTTAAQVPFFVK